MQKISFMCLTWEPYFTQKYGFNRIIKVIIVHDLNPKNLHINKLFFLQNPKNPIYRVFLGIIQEWDFFPTRTREKFQKNRMSGFGEIFEDIRIFRDNTILYIMV